MKTIHQVADNIEKMKGAIFPHLGRFGGKGTATCPICEQESLVFDIIIGVDLFGNRQVEYQMFICTSGKKCGGLCGR
jgi:hypothetical protein